jgi:hypothetical protein
MRRTGVDTTDNCTRRGGPESTRRTGVDVVDRSRCGSSLYSTQQTGVDAAGRAAFSQKSQHGRSRSSMLGRTIGRPESRGEVVLRLVRKVNADGIATACSVRPLVRRSRCIDEDRLIESPPSIVNESDVICVQTPTFSGLNPTRGLLDNPYFSLVDARVGQTWVVPLSPGLILEVHIHEKGHTRD